MSVSSKPESPPLCSENNKVKVVFDYSYFSKHDNKTLDFKTGEEYYLIKKTSDNWFFVKKNICDPVGVYVPRICVAELTEPKPVKNLVRLPSTDASKKKIVPLPRPKLLSKSSNEEKETKPALSKVALEELNDIISEIGVPEHFKDDVQTTTANDVFLPENHVAENKCLLSETQSSGSLSTSPVDSSNDKMTTSGAALKSISDDISSDKNLVLMSTSFIGSQQNEEETKVDSETSDYKTDSRESLRSDGQLLIDNEEVDSDVKPLPISVEDNKGDLTKSNLNNNIPTATSTIQSDDHSLRRTPSTSSHSPSPQLSSIIPRPQLLSTTATTMTSLVKPASEDELDTDCLEYTNASSFMKNKKTEPQLAKVDNSSEKLRKMRNQSMEDYANLGEIQKVIHGMPRPPLAENLMPAGYVKPYPQEKAVLNDAGIVKGATNVDSKHEPSVKLDISKTTTSPTSTPDELQQQQQQSPFDKPSKSALEPKLVEKKGMLNKAKVEESSISKKIKRSWSQSFVILQRGSLSFYKDTKGASVLSKKSSMSSLGKPEFEIVLKGVKLTSAPEDKNLKKDAFMLITTSKTHYLLHHDDPDVNLHWRQSIENNINVLETVSDLSSLPVPSNDKPAHKNIDRLVSTSEVETKQTIAIRLKNFLLRRPTKEAIKLKGIYKDVVFGSSIQSICEREKSKIPRFIRECMLAVESRGLSVDGIYRVSGNMASIQKLRNMVDMNEYYDLSDSTWDIHTITGALKLFFRELSEPLFTYALYDDFIKALHNLNQIKELIKKLPVTNGKTLKALFRHLDIVLQHSKDNRMQSQGLAIVFGPTLLWSDRKVADANMAFDIVQRGQLVEFIINNCRAIFG